MSGNIGILAFSAACSRACSLRQGGFAPIRSVLERSTGRISLANQHRLHTAGRRPQPDAAPNASMPAGTT